MGSEWPVKTIRECASAEPYSTQIGPFGKALMSKEYTESGVPVLRGVNVNRGRFYDDGFVFIEEETADRLAKFESHPGDVLLVHKGTLGQIGLMPMKRNYSRYIMGNSMLRVRCDPAKLLPEYLYYWLSSSAGQHYLFSRVSQVGVPQLQTPLTTLRQAALPVPPLPEQRSIARILGTLDDKIELNRRMNETLEAMAQALFKSWFVDFDPVIDKAMAAGNPIPDSLQKRAEARQALGEKRKPLPASIAQHFPYRFVFNEEMGWIPEGWEVEPLAKMAEVVDCLHSRKPDAVDTSGNLLIQVYNVASYGRMDFTKPYHISDEDYFAWTKRMEILGGDLVVTKTGRVGAVGQMPRGMRATMGRNMVGIRARKGISTPEFLKDALLSDRMQLEMRKNTNDGTILKSLHVKAIEALVQVVPSWDVVACYSEVVGAWHFPIEKNIATSEALVALRDTLLPKLLSGQLRIPDAEKLAEKAL